MKRIGAGSWILTLRSVGPFSFWIWWVLTQIFHDYLLLNMNKNVLYSSRDCIWSTLRWLCLSTFCQVIDWSTAAAQRWSGPPDPLLFERSDISAMQVWNENGKHGLGTWWGEDKYCFWNLHRRSEPYTWSRHRAYRVAHSQSLVGSETRMRHDILIYRIG